MAEKWKRNPGTSRRTFLGGTLAGVAAGSLAGLPAISAQISQLKSRAKMKLKALHPEGAPAADVGYTPGILAEGQRLVFISGQGPRDYNADMETQFRQTFERIKLILEQAGGTMANVAILRAYFVHFNRDLPVYRKVRKEFLVKPYPASTAVGVTELAPAGNQIEIEAVAVL
ncbi:MAG: twin-arginine translocation signal domain-containing protein [Pedosphaera sp.]|nr:twin-arginine translocation signal domain-containing protein [Pedosphaera sp.]